MLTRPITAPPASPAKRPSPTTDRQRARRSTRARSRVASIPPSPPTISEDTEPDGWGGRAPTPLDRVMLAPPRSRDITLAVASLRWVNWRMWATGASACWSRTTASSSARACGRCWPPRPTWTVVGSAEDYDTPGGRRRVLRAAGHRLRHPHAPQLPAGGHRRLQGDPQAPSGHRRRHPVPVRRPGLRHLAPLGGRRRLRLPAEGPHRRGRPARPGHPGGGDGGLDARPGHRGRPGPPGAVRPPGCPRRTRTC